MDKKTQFNAWYIVIAMLGVLALQSLLSSYLAVEVLPYSEFRTLLAEGKVAEVVVTENRIQGRLKDDGSGREQQFVTNRVDPQIAAELSQYGARFTGATENTLFRSILSWVLPVLIFFGLWFIVFRKIIEKQGFGGGFMSIGKSRAKVFVETDIKVTFADVAGVDEAKAELQEIVNFLKDPTTYGRLGGRLPKGILLVGPPGTGKTLLARAVAGEAGVPFFSISGSEFVELFVGVGAARVRDLFEQARANAPAIIFIDELDALGRARGAFPFGGGHDEKEQTLNQLLAELDGFDSSQGLVLLGATNRPEILDPALLRAGRFDRQVLVDRPDRVGRVQILGVHLKKAKLAGDVKADDIAALTPGFTGADLANLVNEATLLATRRGGDSVTMADFTAAIERIVAGLEKRNRLLNPKEREIVAFHEIGHALVATSLPGSETVHKVSIIPRGIGSLGYTIQRPTEDRYLMTREELINRMAVLLGGRASERLVFEQLSTGAADDLAKATDIARSMVARFGMDATLGQVSLDETPQNFLGIQQMMPAGRRYSEQTAREIDQAVRDLVEGAFAQASEILRSRRDDLERAARRLIEKETLTGDELRAMLERG
ncbi:membrane protease FtsH catalytic subunit [Dongia mobilis]|uniref:ATP-dependent zinc metalloprotease FtsH n=1 Tax=Dongia mobilis TaxID=578943 RepID=A0A4R6WQN2_9PROT|nr:ATP-dependent zinc metalloprotease FtsH [Dongia mobilis]TDQ78852.1 membrane protease FtsH catalytic subunit [Dongia mobilis]